MLKLDVDYIKKCLKEKKMTQKEFAKSLGVSQTGVSHYLLGHNSPSLEVLGNMASILNVPVAFLVWNDGQNENMKKLTGLNKFLTLVMSAVANDSSLERKAKTKVIMAIASKIASYILKNPLDNEFALIKDDILPFSDEKAVQFYLDLSQY